MTDVDTGASIFYDGAYDRENPIRRCLDDMLFSCEQEEASALKRGSTVDLQADDGSPLADFGPVMLYVLEHHILEQVCTAGKSDLPLGMTALALRALSRAATHTRHPLLLHPTTRNSIAELVALASPSLPPVFYSTSPTNVIASMGASPTVAATAHTGTQASSSTPSSATAPSEQLTVSSGGKVPARVARRARLAVAVQEHLLSFLAAVWGHAAVEPALVDSMALAASGLSQYRTADDAAGGKPPPAAGAPISLWLRGILGSLASPHTDVAQAAADVLLGVLTVHDTMLVQWFQHAQHIVAACIAGAIAEAWDACVAQPPAIHSMPATQWGDVAKLPPVRRLLASVRCANACMELCSGRHPPLALCIGQVVQEHVLQRRLVASMAAPATQEQRASQCVLLQLVLVELGAQPLGWGAALPDTPEQPGTGGRHLAASLVRSLLTGQPLVNIADAVRRGPSYLMAAASYMMTDVCTLVSELCPEAAAAALECMPKEFQQHPLADVVALVSGDLAAAQGCLWELTRQSSGADGAATAAAEESHRLQQAILLKVLHETGGEGTLPSSALFSPGGGAAPSPPGAAGGTPDKAPSAGSNATTGELTPRAVVLAAFKLHVAIVTAVANWFDAQRSVDANIALSGLLHAALQWQPCRTLLLGSKRRPPAGDADSAPEAGQTSAPPVSCSLATALRHAWSKAQQLAVQQTRSMGRTPFQGALLARKLQLGLPGAACDEGEGSEVAALAASVVAGTPDPAVQRVLAAESGALDKLIMLDETSNECQALLRVILAEHEDSAGRAVDDSSAD